jgi:hypothetical protein
MLLEVSQDLTTYFEKHSQELHQIKDKMLRETGKIQ